MVDAELGSKLLRPLPLAAGRRVLCHLSSDFFCTGSLEQRRDSGPQPSGPPQALAFGSIHKARARPHSSPLPS